MKVYVALLTDLNIENTQVVGVYTSSDVAISKLEDIMEELYYENKDLGIYSSIVEKYIDDVDKKDYV
jgi:putative ubiquitin-RnfH superfamily antitoxin RatB of RatAB toxin-antitoxin module